jgi:outer membrane protein TolC
MVDGIDDPDDFSLPAKPTLQDCLTYAALNNRQLRAAFHRWQAAVETIEQVQAPPDPKFTYAYYFKEVETRVGPQKQAFTLAQTLPWLGKLLTRGDAAGEQARATWYDFQAEKLELYYRVKRVYFEHYYLGRAISITGDNLKLLEQLEKLIRTRYRAAAASHPDVIRIQIEVGKLQDRLETLKQLQRPLLAELNAELGRLSDDAPLPVPESIPHEPVVTDSEELAAMVDQQNPQLAAIEAQIAQARHHVTLAEMDYIPDVTLAATYIDTGNAVGSSRPSDSGQDAVIGMATVNVPIWWNRLAAGVREARHTHQAALHRRAQASHDLTAQLQRTLFAVEDAQRKIDLYGKTLIPQAGQSLKVTQKAFIAGTSNFNDLIDSQRVLLEFDLSYHRGLADHAIHRAALEQLVGEPLPSERTDPTPQP